MNSRQDRILRALSSIAVGTMAFCLTVPAVMFLGTILFSPWLRSDRLFPPQLAALILGAIVVGVAVGVAVGKRYHCRPGKKHGHDL
jgi:hypothetical protein